MSTTDGKLVLGYVRVSTEMQVQRGRSLTDQDRRVEEHAAYKMGGARYTLQTRSEPGKSGTWTIRQLPIPGVPVREVLSDVVDRCMTEEVHALLVDTQDRLTRDPAVWFVIKRLFLDPYDVRLWIADGDVDFDNPDDETLAGIRAVLDGAEVAKMRRRALRGQRERRAAGYPPRGQIGFGWRSETDEEMRRNGSVFRGLVPVAEEGKWVKWIITQYVERGRTILDICAQLNDRQVPYRESKVPWYPGRVRCVLNNHLHAGLVHDNNGELARGAHFEHRFCDPDVYYSVQDIKRERATRGPRALSQRDAPLLGVIRCGGCGQRLQLHRDRSRQAYYVCPKPQEGESRHCLGLVKRADAVERLVAQAIAEIVAAPRLRQMVQEEASSALGEHRERLQAQRQQLQKKLSGLNRRLDKWAVKFTDGFMSEAAFLQVSRQWEEDKEQAEHELAQVEAKLEQGDAEDRRVQRVMAALDSFQETWQRMEAPRLRQLLLTMIESMTLEPDGNSSATLRVKCYYMPEISYHLPHLREALGEGAGRLARLTITDLAFLALHNEGKSIPEIAQARGVKANSAYSQAMRIRRRTGVDDLDELGRMAQPLIEQYRLLLPVDRPYAKATTRTEPEPTERELEVAGLRAQGLRYREIAGRIRVKEGSISGYFGSLRHKLGAESSREVLMILAAQGKLSLPDGPNPRRTKSDTA